MWDLLIENVQLATMRPGGDPYGTIADAALAVAGGRIAWLGPRARRPAGGAALLLDGRGGWLTPALIDCHTHLVFAGERVGELEERLGGASYAEIAARGGGILATVLATRAASADELHTAAAARLDALVADGVGTVEIKSGYGLEAEAELKMLEVARRLGERADVDVVTTFLGAHALPPEYRDRRAAYLELLCGELLDQVVARGLADAVDAFCEGIAFSPDEVERVLTAAKARGLPVKLHADQLEDLGGAALAARLGAISADHLEHAAAATAPALARAGTVAVLLPGAALVLREASRPPVAALRAAGVPIAVATDANPGSSPLLSLRLAMSLACHLFQLTPAEALAGATVHAARALGLADRGVLEVGRRADLALWDITRPAELVYWLGGAPPVLTVKDGRITSRRERDGARSLR
jgi:imidazolonepropionase